MRLLQTNLGRSRRAQDLLFQTIRESTVVLAVVAEPFRVPAAPPPLKFQGSALRRKYKRPRAPDSGDDAAEQATRDVRGVAEEESWDQWRFQLIRKEQWSPLAVQLVDRIDRIGLTRGRVD